MTDDKALVAAMKDQLESWEFEDPRETWWKWQHQYAAAADRIEALEAENERLRTGLSLIAHHTSNEAVSFEEYYECCRSIARAALAGDSHDQ